jgi:hypothetical protein
MVHGSWFWLTPKFVRPVRDIVNMSKFLRQLRRGCDFSQSTHFGEHNRKMGAENDTITMTTTLRRSKVSHCRYVMRLGSRIYRYQSIAIRTNTAGFCSVLCLFLYQHQLHYEGDRVSTASLASGNG